MLIRSLMMLFTFAAEGSAAGAAGGDAGTAAAGAAGAGGAAAGAGAASPAAAAAPPAAFAESLPEDIRGEAAFRDIKDLPTLAKSYLNAQKMIGDPARVVQLPADPADTAAWDAVYGKLGRPEAADKYGLKAPEGVAVDGKLLTGFQETAHKLGLSTKQAGELFNWWNSAAGEGAAARAAAVDAGRAAATEALKTEWGAAFEQKLTLAKKALDHYGGAELQAELDANGLGNSPNLARVFAKMGAGLAEDGVIGRGEGGGAGALSPGEAKQQIAAKQQDPVFMKAYSSRANPGHTEAMAVMTRLYELAHPN